MEYHGVPVQQNKTNKNITILVYMILNGKEALAVSGVHGCSHTFIPYRSI